MIVLCIPFQAVIQASFHPNEKVQDVMDHVTNCLDDQFKAIKFYLYVTPPTQKLVVSKTLIELNLVPAALLYLSWEVASPETEVPSVGFYFCRDLLTHRYAEANKSGCSLQQAKYPKPLRLENTPTIETSQAREEPAQQISSSTAKPANKPSWLKL
ncbi:hypothetical protein PsorP6_002651 [Peronosclerospora sorghi]|uniref:Uncharacterized protein n=1 Tax=Peronosclerospora sorghi TaxID=230839 RepID=A0ACC0WSU8_9STRA|nr:hypothetical protein PsorP6_002651 [Peronosclerospora sorghi]